MSPTSHTLSAASLRTCHESIAEQTKRVGDRPAVIFGDQAWTYRDLASRTDGYSNYLEGKGIQAGDRVGICFRSSPEIVPAVLAVLGRGAIFVPLDPDHPSDRLRQITQDARVKLILSTSDVSKSLNMSEEVVCCDQIEASGISEHTSNGHVSLDSPASILYTSGSTGLPKGVIRSHRGIVSRLAWGPYEEDDVFCHNMSLCYGFSQERLMVPLMLGLRLVILPENCQRESEKFAEMIAHHGITRITVVPAFLEQLVNPKRDLFRHLASIRSVTVGSAALSPQIIRHFHDVLPGVQLMNAYGATESGTLAMGEMHPDDVESVGLPAPNMDVYLLDENLIPVANGDVGEICGAGPSLALGYLERDELTAERFIPNPVHREKGLVYRTGDRGRLLPDGRLQLMGRIDRQVKVRGYRVELSELEVALQQLPGVREAAVIHQPLDNYDNRLIAYLCTNEGITVSRVRKHLRTRVPDHMLPSAYVFLDTLPRTPIGKVIVSSLPEPGSGRPKLDTPYVVPATILEDQIASIWAEVLEIACIGRDDHFMDVGGDSILAAQIVAAVESRTGIRAGIMSLFEWPTVAEFSKVIALELEKAQKL